MRSLVGALSRRGVSEILAFGVGAWEWSGGAWGMMFGVAEKRAYTRSWVRSVRD